MPSLPAVSVATAASATEGDVKNFLTYQHWFLSDLFGGTGEKQATRAALQIPMHSKSDKSGAYTVVASDQGRVLTCSGTWTLSLTAAATLGDGFVIAAMNTGAGTITIDPAGTETIDGVTTKALSPGKMLLIYCNGAAFSSVGSVDAASIAQALGYTPANAAAAGSDHNHNGVYAGMNAIVAVTLTYVSNADTPYYSLSGVRANGSTF